MTRESPPDFQKSPPDFPPAFPPDVHRLIAVALRATPRYAWTVLELLAPDGREWGGRELRDRVVGPPKGRGSARLWFASAMIFLRDVDAVAFRRPDFPGELGERDGEGRELWIYRIAPTGRALLATRATHAPPPPIEPAPEMSCSKSS